MTSEADLGSLARLSHEDLCLWNGKYDFEFGNCAFGSAGVSPAVWGCVEGSKIAGETPALQDRGGGRRSISSLVEGEGIVRNAG
jgi:hypothetical protein